MQKKISILVTILFLCFGTSVFAQSNLTFGKSQISIIAEKGTKNILLDIDKTGSEKINLEIKTADGDLLNSLVIDEAGVYKKRLILADLPSQQLTLNFEGSVNEYTQPVDLQANEVQINAQNLESFHKPTLKQRGDKIFVQWIFRTATDIEITMTDTKSDLFFKEELKTEGVYTRSFNVAQLLDGEYFLTFYNGKKSYILQFVKTGMTIENVVALK